jgi:Mannosyl-glycoprotein endo-beta-N-acetylglucosaminidase
MAVEFVSREEWGAKPPRKVTRRDPSSLAGVAVHWFGKPSSARSHDGCPELLRGVQSTHMAPGGLGTSDGASDIGYNHSVCPHGVAYTLRGFGVQTGANGTTRANEEYAAVVYMGGEEDEGPISDEALPVLTAVIREWQNQGAGPLVKPHGFFTGSTCPGPQLRTWLDLIPKPWQAAGAIGPRPPVRDETPPWLLDFVNWRLVLDGDAAKRPASLPARIPESAWEVTAQIDRIGTLMGPQEQYLDWVEWRRRGAKKTDRPRSAPERIPEQWFESLERLQKIFKGIPTTKPAQPRPKPRPKPETEPAADDGQVTPRSTLVAAARANRKTLERYMLSRQHGGYRDDEVREIVGKYVTTCKGAGLDPLLVVAQMVLETGNLMSFWSQPPRRNPAGIGVTGAAGAGLSFSNWDKAVIAHVGRVLAYALPADDGTEAQRKLVEKALKVRPLPDRLRGAAPDLRGLAGTWAADKKYADKISGVANEIRRHA